MDQGEYTRSPRVLLTNHLPQHSYLQCQKYIRIWPTNLFLQCHNSSKSLPNQLLYRNVADRKCQRQCNFPRQLYNTPKRPTKCKGGHKSRWCTHSCCSKHSKLWNCLKLQRMCCYPVADEETYHNLLSLQCAAQQSLHMVGCWLRTTLDLSEVQAIWIWSCLFIHCWGY